MELFSLQNWGDHERHTDTSIRTFDANFSTNTSRRVSYLSTG